MSSPDERVDFLPNYDPNGGQTNDAALHFTPKTKSVARTALRVVVVLVLIAFCIAIGVGHKYLFPHDPENTLCEDLELSEAPSLKQAPVAKEVGITSFVVSWTEPLTNASTVCQIVGYTVHIKAGVDNFSQDADGKWYGDGNWSDVGFVRSQAECEFTVSGLLPDTPYLVMVAVVTNHPTMKRLHGPSAFIQTLAKEPPVLTSLPTSSYVGKTNFTVLWDDKYRGDGPVVGYVIKVREANPEGIGGALQSLEAWIDEGYVPVGTTPLEYNVTHRHPNTSYHVMVVLAANTCGGPSGDGAGSPPSPGPIMEIRTLEYVPPVLASPPMSSYEGKTNFTVTWDDKYRGDGPVVGYIIKVREANPEGIGGALQSLEEAWINVGYVPVGTTPLEYNVTCRNADTLYQVMVVLPAITFDGPRGDGAGSPPSPRQIMEVRTLAYLLPKLKTAPRSDSVSASSIDVSWVAGFSGDGPVSGYIINVRQQWHADWKCYGYCKVTSDLEYTVNGLQPDTEYEVMVTLAHYHSGMDVVDGPIQSGIRTGRAVQHECPGCPGCQVCRSGSPKQSVSFRSFFAVVMLSTLIQIVWQIKSWRS